MPSSRRKVVLYNPKAVFFTMPLALLAVGSELDPALYEVIIVDGRLDPAAETTVASHMHDAVCLGVSVLTGAPISDAVRISRAAKKARADVPVIWGGWHPSMFGIECLAEPSVDVTVQGQGEATFLELVERLIAGQSLIGCAGCTIRLPDRSVHINPARTLLPVESFRAHDYSLIPVERYFALKGKRQLDYISSQGCNFRCAFCSDPFVYGRKWVGLDPQSMVASLQKLWQRYQFTDVNLQDETFFTRRDRVQEMSQQIIDKKLEFTWAATMRADQGVRLPEETWRLAKRSGLRRLLVGVESGDDAMLKRIRKDITIDQVFQTAQRMLEFGIAGTFPFIVGFPNETDSSVAATIECAKRLRGMNPAFETPIFYFKPYPGSAIVTEAVAAGFRLPDNLTEWSQFDFVAGLPGPWVTRAKFKLIERFKFFQEHAWKQTTSSRPLLGRLARYRCRRNDYRWPLEMVLTQWLWPDERLS